MIWSFVLLIQNLLSEIGIKFYILQDISILIKEKNIYN